MELGEKEEDTMRCRASGYSEALLELCPLPGVAAPKLLSPLRQGLLKLSLESQTLPTHLSEWGIASPTKGAEPG